MLVDDDLSGEVDHYAILGLPSGEGGAKLTQMDISRAYHSKFMQLHYHRKGPPDDPDTLSKYHKLRSSCHLLKDDQTLNFFDDLLRVRRELSVLSVQNNLL